MALLFFVTNNLPLTKVLTGREMLTLFARIRGLRSSENRINVELEKLASFVDLTQYLDRPCGQYSGGNKRKLNVALALIGRCSFSHRTNKTITTEMCLKC